MICSSAIRRRGFLSRNFLVGLVLFILCAGFAIHRQALYLANMRPYRPYLTINLIPGTRSNQVIKAAALGYDDFLSVFLWLRSIQDFGGQFRDPFALESQANAFWSITALQPLFTEAYDFGGLVIGDEGGSLNIWGSRVRPVEEQEQGWQFVNSMEEARQRADAMNEQALALFEHGIESDPDHFRHAYNAVYTSVSGLHDPRRAVPYAEVATLRPDCPDWVAGTIPYLQGRSGEHRIAMALWFARLREAISARSDLQIGINMRKIAEDGVNAWNCQTLTAALSLWSGMHGRALPDSLDQLVTDGFLTFDPEDVLASIELWRAAHSTTDPPPDLQTLVVEGFFPADPENPPEPLAFFDYIRFLDDVRRLQETTSQFETIREADLNLEMYLTVQGRIPDCPLNAWYIHSGDAQMLERMQRIGPFSYMVDHRDSRVWDTNRLFEDTARDLVSLRRRLSNYHGSHDQWPETLDELFPEGESAPVERGTGLPFIYDPADGTVHCRTFPALNGEINETMMGPPRPVDEGG
ncbi:hypothetical protein JXA47_06015 [Candidatus Sumerlaeota bacterium]|nr:hypothetical protein [Candidatus Sumerlaeota bacterium]